MRHIVSMCMLGLLLAGCDMISGKSESEIRADERTKMLEERLAKL